MNKQKVLTLAAAAALMAASTAFAGGLDLTTEMFQWGDSMYAWDKNSGGAVRVGAVWDGFVTPEQKKAIVVFQEGDYVFQRDGSGRAVSVGAVWDGAMASPRSGYSTLALKR